MTKKSKTYYSVNRYRNHRQRRRTEASENKPKNCEKTRNGKQTIIVTHLKPPTCGRILLHTSYGDVDVELWSKEAPKACRNFVQLALEGFYDETIFHRVVKGTLVQGGDKTGKGEGNETIWGKPFRDEFHSRIKFNHRGQLAMANSGYPNSNGCQFFFTLDKTPWLDQKITGNTIFNALRMGGDDIEVDENDRPLDPLRLDSIEVIVNPFDDLVPRVTHANKSVEVATSGQQKKVQAQRAERRKRSSKKDFKLLSFGEEAEDGATTITTSTTGGMRFVNDSRDNKKSVQENSATTFKVGKGQDGARRGADANMAEPKKGPKPMRDEDGPTLSPSPPPAVTPNYGDVLIPKVKAAETRGGSIPQNKGGDKQPHPDWDYGDDQEQSRRDREINAKAVQIEALRKELREQQLAAETERKRKAGGGEIPSTSSVSVLEQMRLKYKKPKVSGSQREAETLAKLSKFKAHKNDQDEDEYDDWLPEKDFSDQNTTV